MGPSATRLVFAAAAFAILVPTGCDAGRSYPGSDRFRLEYRNALRALITHNLDLRSRIEPDEYTARFGRRVMRDQAKTEAEVARRLERFDSPAAVRPAVKRMVAAIRAKAARDRRTARDPHLSRDEFDRALCCNSPRFEKAREELRQLGYNPFVPLVSSGRARGKIHESTGRYLGAGLGDSVTEARAHLGTPRREELVPASFRDPRYDGAGGGCLSLPCGGPTLGYGDSFFRSKHDRITQVLVYGSGARTQRGVAVNDPLDRVGEAYGRAVCHKEKGGGTFDHYYRPPYCELKTGRRVFITFFNDPVSLITLTRQPVP